MQTAELKTGQTLYELLSLRDENSIGKVRELAALRIGQMDADHATALGLKVSQWSLHAFGGELEKALKPNPFELLAKGWNLFSEVRKAVHRSKGPPASAQEVSLWKHELEVKLEPRLVLSVQGVDWSDVTLGVSLKMKFESVRLVFNDGAIRALHPGPATGTLSLSVEREVVGELKRSLALKASYEFEPPLDWPLDRKEAHVEPSEVRSRVPDAPRVRLAAQVRR